MGSKMIGVEIGNDTAKMAVWNGGRIQTLAARQMPDNLVREGRITAPDALAAFLKDMRRDFRIPSGDAALVLPPQAVIAHTVVLPAMSPAQLALNLHFEFRDYVGQEGAKYSYDYALMNTTNDADGQPVQYELFAAAVRKELIDSYYEMFRRAGLKLKVAVPPEMAWLNLVRRAKTEPRELCIVDLGHTVTQVDIYADGRFMMGKEIEIGGQLLDETIASSSKVDSHVARTYKESDMNGVLSGDDLSALYNNLAIEILKAVNFYGYDTPNSNLQDLYYCGGMANIEPLRLAILKTTDLTMHHISRLLPGTDENDENVLRCALAAGAAAQ